MAELIAIIILVGSLVGMMVVVWRKIPALAELPEAPSEFSFKNNLLKLKENIKILCPFKYFSGEIFLQKILSKIRILTLRVESKTANWLERLREKSRKRKENDNYWKEIKESTKNGEQNRQVGT